MTRPAERDTHRRTRILFAVQTYPDGGGIARIVENFVSTLEPRYEVHLAVVDPRPQRAASPSLSLPDARVHKLGYSNVINPLLAPASIVFLARTARFLRQLVETVEPELLIVQDGLNLPVPGLLAT